MFPPTFWSVHANVLDKVSRTSNQAESWHNRWTKLIGATHVGIMRILGEIKKEIRYSIGLISSIQSGTSARKRKRQDTDRETRIEHIVQNFGNYSLPDYLNSIASNLGSN